MSVQKAELNKKQTTIIELNKDKLRITVTTERELQPSSKPFTGDEDNEINMKSNAHAQNTKSISLRKPTVSNVRSEQKED